MNCNVTNLQNLFLIYGGKEKMNKTELVVAMANQSGLTKKDAEVALNAFTEVVKYELAKGGNIQIIGFGSFEVGERAERNGRNPQTGEDIVIPACKAPKFKAGKALKEAVNVF